ncbi:DNA polymerase [Aegicerativicinus sediminis]|uniref:DNA polymerase n=1 Tax=Aegicerativicinus sediminis TaxID=2893202 RepID=UPI001E59D1E6|nr:DNA polymerase [Aegicerativicinus sediminis]
MKATYDLERKLVEVVTKMEFVGICIDAKLRNQCKVELESLRDELLQQISTFTTGDFNINSTKDLSGLLFGTLGITPKIEKSNNSGNYPVDKIHLLKLVEQHEIIPFILKYRKVCALLKFCTQLEKVNPVTNRLHTQFNQIGTDTGRFSSSKPNLQNIPNPKSKNPDDRLLTIEGEFRQMFIPKNGWLFVCADYSQIELRIMAHYSQDPFLLKAYELNQDLHKLTASQIYNVKFDQVTDQQRNIAKSINFGLIYGKTAYGLAPDLTRITGNHHTHEEAQKIIDAYFEKLPAVKNCLNSFIDQADNLGYSETYLGRRRPIPQLASNKTSEREAGKRIAMNTPIQGTAADIIKMAMVKCDDAIKKEGLKAKLLLTVHDELLFEAPKSEQQEMEQLVRENMENAAKLLVQLKVDLKTGNNWAEVH